MIQKCDFIGSGETKSLFQANLTGIPHETNDNKLNEIIKLVLCTLG